MGIVEDELLGGSVFRNRAVLDFDYIPPDLPHREQEQRALARMFKPVLEGSMTQNAYVTGPVGTGKTVLTRKFAQEFRTACRTAGRRLEFHYINCRANAAEGLVLTDILGTITGRYPSKGFSTSEMLRDLRRVLQTRESDLLLLLDEADALLTKAGSDLVYQFTRFTQGDAKAPRVHLVLASMRGDLLQLMDDAARSTFKRSNMVRVERYTAEQLVDILAFRVREGFNASAVDDELVELVADIAAEEGDARYAIELLEHAGRLADGASGETVLAEHVREAKANTRSFVTESKLRPLPRHQLYTLLALGRRLRRTQAPFATTGEVEQVYAVVAEEYEETPRAHTQFWKYLKDLENTGWIRIMKTPGGATGKTQRISLPDVPAAVLVDKVAAVLAQQDDT